MESVSAGCSLNTKGCAGLEIEIYAEVVTHVAGSFEAVGLPGNPQMLIC
jgi:hypothetical protein